MTEWRFRGLGVLVLVLVLSAAVLVILIDNSTIPCAVRCNTFAPDRHSWVASRRSGIARAGPDYDYEHRRCATEHEHVGLAARTLAVTERRQKTIDCETPDFAALVHGIVSQVQLKF